MKRILFVFLLLAAAAGLMAAPVIDWHGRLMYGVIYDPEADKVGYGFSYAELLNHIALSDLTALDTELNVDSAFKPFFQEFSGTVQVGKALGWDLVNPVFKYGWAAVAAVNYTNSGYVYESLIAYDAGVRPTLLLDIIMGNALHLVANINPASFNGDAWDFILNAYGQFGPMNLSMAYYSNKKMDGGLLGFDAGFRYKLGPVSGSVDAEASFDLSTEIDNQYARKIGIGWLGSVGPLTLDWSGQWDNAGFVAHGIGAYYTAAKFLSFALGLQMVNNDEYVFDSIEPSALFTIGQARVRVGYLWDPSGMGQGMFYAPGSMPGGAFIKADVSF